MKTREERMRERRHVERARNIQRTYVEAARRFLDNSLDGKAEEVRGVEVRRLVVNGTYRALAGVEELMKVIEGLRRRCRVCKPSAVCQSCGVDRLVVEREFEALTPVLAFLEAIEERYPPPDDPPSDGGECGDGGAA